MLVRSSTFPRALSPAASYKSHDSGFTPMVVRFEFGVRALRLNPFDVIWVFHSLFTEPRPHSLYFDRAA